MQSKLSKSQRCLKNPSTYNPQRINNQTTKILKRVNNKDRDQKHNIRRVRLRQPIKYKRELLKKQIFLKNTSIWVSTSESQDR